MTKGQRNMTDYKLISTELTPEMIESATEAFHLSSSISSIVRAALAVAPAVQVEPVGWQRVDRPERIITVLSRRTWKEVEDGVEFRALYAAPQPTEQKPVCPACPTCYGRGWDMDCQNEFRPATCPDCAGSGKAEHSITVQESDSAAPDVTAPSAKFKHGNLVRKTKGSQWKGRVVGTYSTSLTPEGYAVESDTEKGSVQIYPVGALELVAAHRKQGGEA